VLWAVKPAELEVAYWEGESGKPELAKPAAARVRAGMLEAAKPAAESEMLKAAKPAEAVRAVGWEAALLARPALFEQEQGFGLCRKKDRFPRQVPLCTADRNSVCLNVWKRR